MYSCDEGPEWSLATPGSSRAGKADGGGIDTDIFAELLSEGDIGGDDALDEIEALFRPSDRVQARQVVDRLVKLSVPIRFEP